MSGNEKPYEQPIPRYRHEHKFVVGPAERIAIRSKLLPVMKKDPHVRPDGCYQIRSIYFDNYRDKALREKVDGCERREKFRIRWYNDDLSFITLEKKIKDGDLCLKCDAAMTEEQLRRLLSGDTSWMMQSTSLVQELYFKMKTQLLRPRVLVSYLREPYIYAPGNVRVTFDFNVRSSLWQNTFLDRDLTDIHSMEESGDVIMEVKYDDFIPEIIACLLQSQGIRPGTFSKYEACRRFG